jgi:hypothetical protein
MSKYIFFTKLKHLIFLNGESTYVVRVVTNWVGARRVGALHCLTRLSSATATLLFSAQRLLFFSARSTRKPTKHIDSFPNPRSSPSLHPGRSLRRRPPASPLTAAYANNPTHPPPAHLSLSRDPDSKSAPPNPLRRPAFSPAFGPPRCAAMELSAGLPVLMLLLPDQRLPQQRQGAEGQVPVCRRRPRQRPATCY